MTWLKVTCAMLAKLVITSSYGTIYVFTAEQFPTVIRNVGLGASSTFARVGGVVAPYINYLVGTQAMTLKFHRLHSLNDSIIFLLIIVCFLGATALCDIWSQRIDRRVSVAAVARNFE